ncbi:MAG: F0F1 ATP synthase subunit B', partial [Rhodospirillales bacterium]|nr:F0F1 ATP synthase subunit B' [Rhodospirillales bacterium]
MPQLDVASYLPQFVWLVIAFITLYFLMSRMALPRVGVVLEERG